MIQSDTKQKTKLMMDIVDGKYKYDEVEQIIQNLEEQFGKDCFADYEFNKKNDSWDMAYLKELKTIGVSGIASKQFFLHLAKVSEFVYSNKKKKMMIKIIVAIIIVVLLIVLIIFACEYCKTINKT